MNAACKIQNAECGISAIVGVFANNLQLPLKSLASNLLVVVFLFEMPVFLAAQDGQTLFRAGLDFFEKGDFKQAAEQFERIRENGLGQSGELFFNLGNCHFKLRQPGRAVLNYERALRLDPRFEPARQNLLLVRQSLEDDFPENGGVAVFKFWAKIRDAALPETWAWLTILFGFLTVAGLGLRLFQLPSFEKLNPKKIGMTVFSLAGLMFLVAFFLAKNAADRQQNTREAILIIEKAGVFSGPDPNSEQLAEIHEGIKIGIENKIENWLKVSLPTGEIGWLPADAAEKI